MQADTLQSESQQPKYQTTLAEQFAESDHEGRDAMLDSTTEDKLPICWTRTTSKGEFEYAYEFQDGSIYDEYGDCCISEYDYLDGLSTLNQDVANSLEQNEKPLPTYVRITIPASGWVELTGIVERDLCSSCIDLPLRLTAMERDGEPYLMGSSDFHEEPRDEAPIAYTHELAGLVGQRVAIRCQPSTYTERRATTRGNGYHVNVEYLDAPKVVKVLTTKTDFGDVSLNGTTIHLTQAAYADGDEQGDEVYRARGVDDEGNDYEVLWETTAQWDATPNDNRFDEGSACDWSKYTVRAL